VSDLDFEDEPEDEVPPLDRHYENPDPDCTWAHPDGHLHADPPLPVARVSFSEAGFNLPIFGGVGWWPPIEAPACGAVLDVPAEATPDGQRRRFACDRPVGHTDKDDPDKHRCVIWNLSPSGGGKTTTWTDATISALTEAIRRAGVGE
jgi:hypothetical protein